MEEGASREEPISHGGIRGRKVRAGVPAVRVEGDAHQDVHGECSVCVLPIFLESFVQHSHLYVPKYKDRFNFHINRKTVLTFADVVVLTLCNPE